MGTQKLRWLNWIWVLCGLFFDVGSVFASDVMTHRRSGNQYEWAGRGTASDYQSSGSHALFRRSVGAGGQTGGYGKIEIDIEHGLGWLMPDTVPQMSRQSVMDSVKADSEILKISRVFESTGGRYVLGRGDEGRYQSNPFQIEFTFNEEYPAIAGRILFHEYLHAFTDRSDLDLWEFHSDGGVDHFLIQVLEERFILTRLLASGESPFSPKIYSLNGFIEPGSVSEILQPLFQSKNRSLIRKLVEKIDDRELERLFVNSGMMTLLSTKKFHGSRSLVFGEWWNDDALKDLGYLYAINFQILRVSLKVLAQMLISETSSPYKSVEEFLSSEAGKFKVRQAVRSLQTQLKLGHGLTEAGNRVISAN